ncbi:maleylpyruvate isomerase N-terminal domain-containing protein [Catellatospora citrea]|uniref:Mycothiol-dependent maleylpyruvate isomerase metal-binding domain-containing protein n=1 Tax=Catellatospora citrea TaxID=53366 RepID=A0A8J3K9Z4_9ACTN|nr:maleylpyruvate isomerase N-terminal domain-containing protein [Catellatospora citrea]RKE12729.1 mycothiol maleylpyruvate isomerase-like protein [Catellatospora citrea]GIF96031.1 hypothetical protein Cci01nite_11250 [Catellatospora citrea]
MTADAALARVRRHYLDAARAAAELLRDPAVAGAWDRPSALARYTVSGLAGHLAGQVFFAERALRLDRTGDPPLDILSYYDRVAWMNSGHDDPEHQRIRRGSQASAADGPAALSGRVDAAVAGLPGLLADEPVARTVRLPGWAWSLTYDDFLLSRLVELVVHVDDLAVSVHVPAPPPDPAAAELVIDLLTRVAARRHGPLALVRALTRAERAPAGIAAF